MSEERMMTNDERLATSTEKFTENDVTKAPIINNVEIGRKAEESANLTELKEETDDISGGNPEEEESLDASSDSYESDLTDTADSDTYYDLSASADSDTDYDLTDTADSDTDYDLTDTADSDTDYNLTDTADLDTDYSSDLELLKSSFPALSNIESIGELESPDEYARFRGLGLTPKEALLATGQSLKPPPQRRPTSPIATRGRSERIPEYYLKMAREIFHGLSDREIQVLYKKVK